MSRLKRSSFLLVLVLLTGCQLGVVEEVATPALTPEETPVAIALPSATAAQPTSTPEPPPSAVPATDYPAPTPQPTETPTGYPPVPTATPGSYTYRILNTYPHDPDAFTQGLVIDEAGNLFEGTGLYGRSSLRRVDLETGEVLQMIELPPEYFGEGITLWDGRIIQLTWRARSGFVYDKDSFDVLQEFKYPTEGWGITHDDEKLIMSDGTATLYFWDPETLEEIGRVDVFDENGPVVRLNELEYINGEVWANVWQTDRVVRIDPETGRVTGSIDFSGLLEGIPLEQPVDVLNGIAYDEENGRLFVTGKLWPVLFEVEVLPQE